MFEKDIVQFADVFYIYGTMLSVSLDPLNPIRMSKPGLPWLTERT